MDMRGRSTFVCVFVSTFGVEAPAQGSEEEGGGVH